MLKKGRKREAKGLAVLYFIIGLIILLIILAVVYFALAKLDYSDKVDPETTLRPYVEGADATAIPDNVSVPSDEVPEYVMPEDEVDLTQDLEVLPGTEDLGEPEPEPTPEPEPEVTEEPTPEPTEAPTPEPTALPAGSAAQPMTDNLPKNLPAAATENSAAGITGCYVSAADDNKLMVLSGYGYVNEETFDGTKARTWLIVRPATSDSYIAYPLTLTDGVSGLGHASAVAQNASAADFQVTLDVSQYQEGIYNLALVIGYVKPDAKNDRDATYAYYPFGADTSFTILDGQVVTPVNTVDYE